MKLSLACPACHRAIADLNPKTAPDQVHCDACGQQYGVLYGKLARRSSVHEALLYLRSNFPSFYKRHYTLQITTADRTLKQLQFSIPGKADVVPVRSGDIVSVLYTMQGYVMQKMVAIANHTTGKQYVLPHPVLSKPYQRLLLLIAIAVFSGLAWFLGISWWGRSLVYVGMLLAYYKLTHQAHLTSPDLTQHASMGQRLLDDQRLLNQHRKIEQRIAELKHERRSQEVLIQQLETLKQKMAALDPTLYSARIYRATGAINILKQQIVNHQRLVREYERTLKMIDIEIDTSWIADQLPDAENFSRTIVERLTELQDIEAQNRDLALQLTAYNDLTFDPATSGGTAR